METQRKELKAIIHKAEEGGYWAEVPALPGCYSQGETLQEIRVNIKEAINLYIESANASADEADETMDIVW